MDPEKVNYHYTDDLPTTPLTPGTRVLVTGANGYIGRRLIPELVARGYQVRCMLRNQGMPPLLEHPRIDVVYADGMDKPALAKAMEGVQAAYYLMHSLRLDKRQFQEADKEVARNFVKAADQCGVGRIIYLGGLGETSPDLSEHLKSRMEVGAILSEARCPVIRLRAAIILGAGSASYELVKSLVKNHRWIPFLPEFNSLCQPLAIRDVIKYLVGVLELPDLETGKYPIGGADVLTYKELIQKFARILGRRVRFFNVAWVPVPTPSLCRLFAFWMHFFSPVPVNIAC
ncbi:MAG: NAD(P)H-binding protein, partial [Nitrospinaceae bacterium]